MNKTVEILPTYRIAYVRQMGQYGPANIQTMDKIKKWAEEKKLLKSAIILGIPQDNPETTLPENCRYDACIVISPDYQLDDSICEGELIGGEYLIYRVKHTTTDIQKAWAEILLLLQNGEFQMEQKPIIERYTFEMIANGYCELCVPVKQA
ncbi:GyrI-like domain-containing protein [Cytobacillus sp. Hz8]|uniref:AraC family transcriptional regulator n=1 Tax=Cytobacillus sp. Hz8 TaxID=3347168 RepID=UPI0035DD7485